MMVESYPVVKMHLLGGPVRATGKGILRPYGDVSGRGGDLGTDRVSKYLAYLPNTTTHCSPIDHGSLVDFVHSLVFSARKQELLLCDRYKLPSPKILRLDRGQTRHRDPRSRHAIPSVPGKAWSSVFPPPGPSLSDPFTMVWTSLIPVNASRSAEEQQWVPCRPRCVGPATILG